MAKNTHFIEKVQFSHMLSHAPCVTDINDKKKIKYNLLDHIQTAIGDKWDRLKDGTRQALDNICFFGVELGLFYASDKYLAEHNGVSDRTIRNRMKELQEIGQVVKLNKRARKCNGRGKAVYLFVNHPYFEKWIELLNLSNFQTDFHTENSQIPCESNDEDVEKVSTYGLPKKQEKNIITNPIIHEDKIVQYVSNRIQDARKKGTVITYLSSYVDRVVRSLERQALFAENLRSEKARKAREDERKKLGIELGIIQESEPGFNGGPVSAEFKKAYYYWLD